MAMINLGSSMRYGPSGKRRKTNAWTVKKKKPIKTRTLKPCPTAIARAAEAQKHREKYPSWTGTHTYSAPEDQSYKQEVSKNYTVSIAYNKGAYQVIPKKEVKSIGR